MLQVYLSALCEACSDILRYIDGVDEFENVLGHKYIDLVQSLESESSWILHELDFK